MKGRKKTTVRKVVLKAAGMAACAAVLFLGVLGLTPQHGNQMFPAVKDGDLAVSLRLTQHYRCDSVVAYRDPYGRTRLGRIVGMPGDQIDISREGQLRINGQMAVEEIFYPTVYGGKAVKELPAKVPDEYCFILNDHREETDDSREFGMIAYRDLRGEVIWLFRIRGF